MIPVFLPNSCLEISQSFPVFFTRYGNIKTRYAEIYLFHTQKYFRLTQNVRMRDEC